MGLFSKSVTVYASQVMSLIEENPKFIPSTIRNAILTGNDIAAALQAAMTDNISIDAKRYYAYGRDHYYYGLPTGTFAGYYVDTEVLSNVLEQIEGASVYIEQASLSDTPDGKFFILDWLSSVGYDWVENTFTYNGHICTLISAEITDFLVITVTYSYRVWNSQTSSYDIITAHISRPSSEASPAILSMLYLTAIYYLVDTEGQPTGNRKFFVYNIERDDTYPELAPTDIGVQQAPYYPVVPIRLNNQSLSNLPAYPTAKKLLKKIGITLDDVLEGVESNPDIGDIDHAFIILGFNMDSTADSVIAYMYEYFLYLKNNSIYTETSYNNWLFNFEQGYSTGTPPMNRITVTDSQYRSTINYLYITEDVITGVIGKIGTVDKQINVKARRRFSYGLESIFSGSFYVEQSELVLKKQITATTYSKLTVVGLRHTNHIANKFGVVETSLDEVVNNTDNNNFLVPLNSYIYNSQLSANQRIDLMYECINILMNSVETYKLKWYQTGFFQFVMIVITIVVAVFAPPVGGGLAAATTATEAVIAIATQIAIAVAVSSIIKVAVKVLGLNATIVAIVAVVAAMYGYRNLNGLSTMPWALDLMQTVTSAMNGIGAALKASTAEIMSEMSEFTTSAEDQLKTIYEKIDEMTSTNTLDPLMLFTKVDYYPTETVSDYYYRHCHMTNPGVLSLDIITDYVDTMLTLDY